MNTPWHSLRRHSLVLSGWLLTKVLLSRLSLLSTKPLSSVAVSAPHERHSWSLLWAPFCLPPYTCRFLGPLVLADRATLMPPSAPGRVPFTWPLSYPYLDDISLLNSGPLRVSVGRMFVQIEYFPMVERREIPFWTGVGESRNWHSHCLLNIKSFCTASRKRASLSRKSIPRGKSKEPVPDKTIPASGPLTRSFYQH